MSLINNPESFFAEKIDNRLGVLKITALWAFSESAFGGILHALKIPMRGLFIASAAVLFISLISLFTKNSREILKATLIVILVKAVVSPHSPLNAYLAVSLQGVLGFLFFSTKKYYKLSALLLGLLALFFSGIQKIVVLTILFGNTLWESLDIFIKQVSTEILNIERTDINYGYVFIAAYILLHLSAGLFIGLYAGRLPQKIDHYKNLVPSSIADISGEEIPHKVMRKKKSWFLRPTGIIIIVISASVIIFSYSSPELGNNVAMSVLIMLLRAFLITFLWYSLLVPAAMYLFNKFISKRKSEYSKDLEEIISMFPQFKKIVNYCWKLSKDKKGYKRIRYFLSTSFYYLLLIK
jgi:chromate transport protein ChrA